MKLVNQEQLLQHISDTYTAILRGGPRGIDYDSSDNTTKARQPCAKCWEVKKPGKLKGLLSRDARNQYRREERQLIEHLGSVEHLFEQHGLDSNDWVEDINLIKLSVGICEDERKGEMESSESMCSSSVSSSSSSSEDEDEDESSS